MLNMKRLGYRETKMKDQYWRIDNINSLVGLRNHTSNDPRNSDHLQWG
jgi:hypothetical protein